MPFNLKMSMQLFNRAFYFETERIAVTVEEEIEIEEEEENGVERRDTQQPMQINDYGYSGYDGLGVSSGFRTTEKNNRAKGNVSTSRIWQGMVNPTNRLHTKSNRERVKRGCLTGKSLIS